MEYTYGFHESGKGLISSADTSTALVKARMLPRYTSSLPVTTVRENTGLARGHATYTTAVQQRRN